MKLKFKLVGAFGIVAAIGVAIGGVGLFELRLSGESINEIGVVRLPSVCGIARIQRGHEGIRGNNAGLMADGLAPAQYESLYAAMSDAWKLIDEGWAQYEPLPQSEEEAKLWKEFVPAFGEWRRLAKDLAEAAHACRERGIDAAALGQRREAALATFKEITPSFLTTRKMLDELRAMNERYGAEEVTKSQKSAVTARTVTMCAIGAGAVVACGLGLLLSGSISRVVQRIGGRAKEIAAGDLTGAALAVTSRDELGELTESINTMQASLTGLIGEVTAGSHQIDSGAGQIASSSQSLAQGASEQASSLEQISASLEQMSGMTKQNAENAREASRLGDESKTVADRGRSEMGQMSRAMGEIKQSSSEISKIIRVIDEIAFQTNLLALNAAVEAARAGEAGKGFAVVAEEVRNLAQRSAEAAKNSNAMIDESVKRAENGVQIATRVEGALEEIAQATGKVNTLLCEIASASGEQATGIGQINQGVGQLDQVTQQNAGNSEELASSAEEMSGQITSLRETLGRFKVPGTTGARSAATTRAATRPSTTTAKPTVKAGTPKSASKAGAKATAKAEAKAEAKTPERTATPDPESVIPMRDDEVLASF